MNINAFKIVIYEQSKLFNLVYSIKPNLAYSHKKNAIELKPRKKNDKLKMSKHITRMHESY